MQACRLSTSTYGSNSTEAFTKSSTSSKQAAAVQGSPGATGGGQRRKGDQNKYTLEMVLDQQCKFHIAPGRSATHTTGQCSFIKDPQHHARQLPGPPPEQLAEGQGDQDHEHELALVADQRDDGYPANVEQYHVFITQEEDKRNDLWDEAEVNAVAPPEPQYMHWSEASITWGCEDHPLLMPRPGGYTLVLNPTVFSCTHTRRFSRVLIDGGSNINILY
jgi:hypothetical protein